MYLESIIQKPKSSDKLSISGSELGVRGHPGDGLVRSKETCGIELMDCSLIEVMLKGKRSSKTRGLNEFSGSRIFSRGKNRYALSQHNDEQTAP